jgi:L-ribulose-5-phosphate 3-epimerase
MTTGPRPRLAVCSWSLEPTGHDDLVAKVRSTGLNAVQLALDPIRSCIDHAGPWNERATAAALTAAGITVTSGMMGMIGEDYSTLDTIRVTGGIAPDHTWPANLAAARDNAALAQRLGIPLVTFHAGFLPHESSDPKRLAMIDRLAELARVFADHAVQLALETGQESAGTLLSVLADVNRALASHTPKLTVGVNFDPANMILYGMGNPVDALRALTPAVRQIHIKDALPAAVAAAGPATWGAEVPVGTGAVDWKAFFAVYRSAGLTCPLVIEREAGTARIRDIVAAHTLLEHHFP